jgi:hypothetical protein
MISKSAIVTIILVIVGFILIYWRDDVGKKTNIKNIIVIIIGIGCFVAAGYIYRKKMIADKEAPVVADE